MAIMLRSMPRAIHSMVRILQIVQQEDCMAADKKATTDKPEIQYPPGAYPHQNPSRIAQQKALDEESERELAIRKADREATEQERAKASGQTTTAAPPRPVEQYKGQPRQPELDVKGESPEKPSTPPPVKTPESSPKP